MTRTMTNIYIYTQNVEQSQEKNINIDPRIVRPSCKKKSSLLQKKTKF